MAMLRGSFRSVKDLAHFIPGVKFAASTTDAGAGGFAAATVQVPKAKPVGRFKPGPEKPPPPPTADEYNLKKAEYTREMKKLRSTLYKELQMQRLKELQAEREAAKAVKVQRQQKIEVAKAKKGQGRATREQATADLKTQVAKKREDSKKRQVMREELLADARAQRKGNLLEQSKFWILPEDLDKRIDYALRVPDSLPYNA